MISEFDVEELVRGIFNLDDDEDVYHKLEEKYYGEVSWDCYVKIISDLMPLIIVGQSPLSGKSYQGFGKDGIFYIKQEILTEQDK